MLFKSLVFFTVDKEHSSHGKLHYVNSLYMGCVDLYDGSKLFEVLHLYPYKYAFIYCMITMQIHRLIPISTPV